MANIQIDSDIKRAHTMPASFYQDPAIFEVVKERVFANSWQFLPGADQLTEPGSAMPLTLLEGFLDEPVVVTRDDNDRLRCLSNVCTHRGTILLEEPWKGKNLRCRYHGRCFDLGGHFISAPGFDDAANFPSPTDDLPELTCSAIDKFLFASIDPAYPSSEVLNGIRQRMNWLPLSQLQFDAAASQEYFIDAHWALYCENYLEGFHIPYVHPALATQLDLKAYHTEILDYSVLQIGGTGEKENAFEIPETSEDYGQLIAAYYFFLFPNTMFNFYPWGLSVNVVTPLSVNTTRINYYTYVLDASRRGTGAGGALDKVEIEDQAIVRSAQRGLRSRLYERGRYAPAHETGVHHFHSLLAAALE